MGELILCSHPIAAMPYYIDNISLNVYSLEELCYYIENHLYLIEADFMSEELCLWIGQELDEKDLAQSLRSVLLGNGSLSDFTELILRSCGYCSEDTIRHIRSVLLDMQNKSVFECSKIRADRYMESEKYVKAIHEYRKLLGMEEECKKNPVYVLPGQYSFYDLKLLLYSRYHLIEKFLRNEWQCLQRPSLILFIIYFRITHRDKMTNTPGYDCLI